VVAGGEVEAGSGEVEADFTWDKTTPNPSTAPSRCTAAAQPFSYISVSSNPPISIRLHNASMDATANFPILLPPGVVNFPNGVATDGVLIFHANLPDLTVYVTDFTTGMIIRSFSIAPVATIQGMDLVNGDLGVLTRNSIPAGGSMDVSYYNPSTGALQRTVTCSQSSGDFTEAIAFDGTTLWLLNANIDGYDPNGGNRTRVLINPAAVSCPPAGGTGMGWEQATNSLIIGCIGGQWFRVSIHSGLVTATGNSGQSMFGLKATNC
jgi:hypothetical protein